MKKYNYNFCMKRRCDGCKRQRECDENGDKARQHYIRKKHKRNRTV